jgi:hypothetical protein
MPHTNRKQGKKRKRPNIHWFEQLLNWQGLNRHLLQFQDFHQWIVQLAQVFPSRKLRRMRHLVNELVWKQSPNNIAMCGLFHKIQLTKCMYRFVESPKRLRNWMLDELRSNTVKYEYGEKMFPVPSKRKTMVRLEHIWAIHLLLNHIAHSVANASHWTLLISNGDSKSVVKEDLSILDSKVGNLSDRLYACINMLGGEIILRSYENSFFNSGRLKAFAIRIIEDKCIMYHGIMNDETRIVTYKQSTSVKL